MNHSDYIDLVRLFVLSEADRLGLLKGGHESYVNMISELTEKLLEEFIPQAIENLKKEQEVSDDS